MEVLASDAKTVHVRIGDFDASGVLARVELRLDREPGAGANTADELDDGLVIDERATAPVLRDVTEEPVLDLVPLGRAGWEVRDADGEARAVSEVLQLRLP